ncbi:acetyl-CoA carboxylase biotin carboxyl carrier protein [Saccharibacillus sp. CPCC 101409]|uniref:acetyl-CoA carboxylase biotin carboxyl carrier protein n=1 Tax=Saccharibacillus sp. CPCC 101409 TaxID=3058041 RepID=UPI002673DF04|nr:acetyl-CoA carboxylase biotin carboxyl carrier protein [Saccharibacillus sp. CPCC 101409]MDO3409530.1 acetyl-CoA carboxylase biotin carboxyl carrier protein [Saccharibacillus sp. CPCC 101409]
MFKISEIKELIELLDRTSVQELELEEEGAKVVIRKGGRIDASALQAPVILQQPQAQTPAASHSAAPAAAAPTSAPDESLHKIVSPMVGTFYSSPSPDADVYVNSGSRVNEKTVVCIIEAMKLMNELLAEVKGEIVEVLAENGQLVEYGQPLFLVKAE